jgi:hypothetical protein
MIKCKCLNKEGNYQYEYAFNTKEIDYDLLFDNLKFKKGYLEIPATFDIETSTVIPSNENEKPYAFMYIWQLCFRGYVIFGRTWDDFLEMLEKIKNKLELDDDHKLVIYVHNFAFEFEYLRKFIDFKNIFATAPHKVLKANDDFFEFRCSYYLSNMNLQKFISNTPEATHYKSKDDMDYKLLRTPSTELTELEYGYCYNDVKGLEEAIMHLLKSDTLKSIPLTSTGYVRRDCRKAMRKNRKNRYMFKKMALDEETFTLCKECFRGGNTAGSRYYTNEIIHNVGSYDISSSYPYVMMACYFPMGSFIRYTIDNEEDFNRINKKYCTIGRYLFYNIKIKKSVPIPYIPSAKCNSSSKTVVYNGRILEAEMIEISLTNIDFDIIEKQYDFESMYVKDLYVARRGKLPKELREQILHYYDLKTQLKGSEEHAYEYMKAKNRLNGIYGMCVTNPCKGDLSISDDGEWIESEYDIQEKLDKYYSNWNSFLSYQWGIFVSAHARRRLQMAIDKVGLDVIYVDTDSVKYINNHEQDFKDLNDEIEEHISCYRDGKEYQLGIFDSENEKGSYKYDEFITMGAKKYAFTIDGKIGVTVSGLAKKEGAEELAKKGGLKEFKIGTIFENSGRTVAYFNNDEIHDIKIGDDIIKTASNIAIVDTTYTLGITDTMLDIIFESKEEREQDGRD